MWGVFDGAKELVSSYISSESPLRSYVSYFTSTLIASNVLIGCDVETEVSWKLASSWFKALSLYIFLFGEIEDNEDEGDSEIKEAEEGVVLSKGVSGAIS